MLFGSGSARHLAITCPLGTDHEAPTFSQWVPAFSLLLLFGIVCEASHAGQLHGELILAMTTWCCQLF